MHGVPRVWGCLPRAMRPEVLAVSCMTPQLPVNNLYW
jgi:hypothetical protein